MDTRSRREPRYRVLLSIKHPTLSPEMISTTLGIVPSHSWRSEDKRSTPKGTELGGSYEYTLWTAAKSFSGNRNFFRRIIEFIEIIENNREFIESVRETGGRISLIVQIAGDVNIGDEIGCKDLERLVRLGISFGIEVFPRMDTV